MTDKTQAEQAAHNAVLDSAFGESAAHLRTVNTTPAEESPAATVDADRAEYASRYGSYSSIALGAPVGPGGSK